MMSVLIGQLLLCGMLCGGMPGTPSVPLPTADWNTHQELLFAIGASDGQANIPDTRDTPSSLSCGTHVRPTGADELTHTRLRRDLGICRMPVFQTAFDSLLTPTVTLPPLAIVSRGIRLRI
jgi:hypothetical protein